MMQRFIPILRTAQLAPTRSIRLPVLIRAAQSTRQLSTVPSTPSRLAPAELLTVIEETIKTHGPLPVSRYMTLCLAHPTLGYYTTRKVFGSQGDFVTSPEISQIFGELLAIWFVTQWLAQGSAKSVRVVELGPGKGTLLTDMLRTFAALPKGSSPPITSIHLIESSEALREIQRKNLAAAGFGSVKTSWATNIEEVLPASDEEFTIVVAHEFFDAMPIHIFENTSRGWREVMVDIADPKSIIVSSVPKVPLRLVLAPNPTPASSLYTRMSTAPPSSSPTPVSLSFDTTQPPAPSPLTRSTAPPPSTTTSKDISPTLSRFDRLPIGSRMEISPASWEIARNVGKLVSSSSKGGAGLVVDYGDGKGFGRSWRGFRKHQIVDPLSEPGHTDLTANVDFSFLAEAISDVATPHGPLAQSSFLHSLGLLPRLRGLLDAATPERKTEIESAAKRLVDGMGMGKEYKVMGITPLVQGESRSDEECFPFKRSEGVVGVNQFAGHGK